MDILTGLILLLVYLAVSITIFLVCRQLVLWYFRLNQIADNLAYIATYLQQHERQARASAYPTPPTATSSPTFKPISRVQNERLRTGWE